MPFLSGIFGSPAPSPAPAAAPVAAPVVAGPPAGNSATNPTNPAPTSAAPAPNNAAAQQQPAGLDALMALMKPSAEVLAANKAREDAQAAPILPVATPEQVQASLANADFTAGIAPETVAKALAGDQAAFMQVMNATARNAVAANLQMSTTLVEQGVREGNNRFTANVDSRFRELQLRNHTPENPALQHPLAKSMIDTISRNIANANPRLSPQEIAKQAETNFLQFAKDLSAPSAAEQQANKPAERDWLRYLESPSGDAQATQ